MQLDSGFYRRLKFYLFGFLLGALIVNVVFKGRACRMPGTLKLEELREQKREYTQTAICKMKCNNIDTAEVSQVLKEGKVDYGKSDVHKSPCGIYIVDGFTGSKLPIQLIIADCDSISRITEVILDNDSCRCN